jgi:predicted enzyme related to lactoylglutathione lyase
MAEIEMTLGWTIVYVEDPGAAAVFYEGTFGLRTEFVVPGEYAQMNTGTT